MVLAPAINLVGGANCNPTADERGFTKALCLPPRTASTWRLILRWSGGGFVLSRLTRRVILLTTMVAAHGSRMVALLMIAQFLLRVEGLFAYAASQPRVFFGPPFRLFCWFCHGLGHYVISFRRDHSAAPGFKLAGMSRTNYRVVSVTSFLSLGGPELTSVTCCCRARS